MRVASIPMYDMPETCAALDALWAGLARHLRAEGVGEVPDSLVHGRPLSQLWGDPGLLFSQCCGYDVVNRYAATLSPVATPHYAAPGCAGADYASVIVVGEASPATDVLEMRGAVCAVNGHESHSGMNALRALVTPASRDVRFFAAVTVTGTHAASIALVQAGTADVAAIDCVTHALLSRYRGEALAGTRVLGWSDPAPAVPYVTRIGDGEETLARARAALARTFADPSLAAAREALLLGGIEVLPDSDYRRISEMQERAAREGYPVLR